ncbi:MAG: hypothetical protein IPM60_16740 [Rhodospirillales bacterium]|nr:hypothetical protein [Rhodospirillales bacterium]
MLTRRQPLRAWATNSLLAPQCDGERNEALVVIAVEEYEKVTGTVVPPTRDKNTETNGD